MCSCQHFASNYPTLCQFSVQRRPCVSSARYTFEWFRIFLALLLNHKSHCLLSFFSQILVSRKVFFFREFFLALQGRSWLFHEFREVAHHAEKENGDDLTYIVVIIFIIYNCLRQQYQCDYHGYWSKSSQTWDPVECAACELQRSLETPSGLLIRYNRFNPNVCN